VATLTTYLTAQIATYGTGRQAIAAGIADTFWVVLILAAVCILLALVIGRDPALTALRQAKEAKQAEESGKISQIKSVPNVISARTSDGEEVMGPETLLWRYREGDVVNGSLLTVEANHFCVLKLHSAILDVYEAGQYIVQTPDQPDSNLRQLTFNGEPIPLLHEALYINRAKLLVKISGVALSHEMVEVEYRVDYTIHIATREDAIQLVQRMPYRGHTLTIQEINAYAGPLIEQAMNQLVRAIPLELMDKKRPDLSRLVFQHLQGFLSSYGITLGVVNVLVWPYNEHTKALISLKAFGLSELDAVRYYTAMQKNTIEHYLKERYDEREQKLYSAWRNKLEHYADEIVAIQTELKSIRSDLSQHTDAHYTRLSAHLQELSRAIGSDLEASSLASSWGA
jgi:hypothetical protein